MPGPDPATIRLAVTLSLLVLLAFPTSAHTKRILSHDAAVADVQLAVLAFANWVQVTLAADPNGLAGCRVRNVCANTVRTEHMNASPNAIKNIPQRFCIYWTVCPAPVLGAGPRITTLLALPSGFDALQHVPQVPPAQPSQLQGLWDSTSNSTLPIDGLQQADAAPVLDSTLAVAVASLSDLRALHVAGIGLQGTLPSLWGTALPLLAYINVSHNELTGTLPPSFGRLSALTVLCVCEFGKRDGVHGQTVYRDLSDNRLSGAVPQAWGALTTLRSMYVVLVAFCFCVYLFLLCLQVAFLLYFLPFE